MDGEAIKDRHDEHRSRRQYPGDKYDADLSIFSRRQRTNLAIDDRLNDCRTVWYSWSRRIVRCFGSFALKSAAKETGGGAAGVSTDGHNAREGHNHCSVVHRHLYQTSAADKFIH